MSEVQIYDHPIEQTQPQPTVIVHKIYPQPIGLATVPTMQPMAQTKPQESPNISATSLYDQARLEFVRKVFAIMTLQLLVTVGMTLASMFSEVYFQFQATHHWVMYVCLGISVLTFAMGIWLKYTRVPPFNYLNLLLFTVSLSYVVGFICSVTDKNLVLMAALETLSVVVVAAAYSLIVREVYIAGWALVAVVIMSLICLAVSMPLFYQTYAKACGICWMINFIFAVQLVVDVRDVMDNDSDLSLDDYIPAAMIIYYDFIRLLIRIIVIVGRFVRRRR